MSKNNTKLVQQKMADQKQKFGIRKLSVGVASVLLGTMFYMQGGTVHADVNPNVSVGNASANVASENSVTSTSDSTVALSELSSTNSASSVNDVASSTAASQTSVSSVKSTVSQATSVGSAVNAQESASPASQVTVGADKAVNSEDVNVASSSAQTQNDQGSTSVANTVATSNASDNSAKDTTPWYTEQEKLAIAKENIVVPAPEGSEIEKNGGLDPSVWGTFNINDWDVGTITIKRPIDGKVFNGVTLTGYHGNKDHIILPGSSLVKQSHPELFTDETSNNVYITSDFVHKLIMDNNPITFAINDSSLSNADTDWSWAFARTTDKKTLLGDSRLTKVNIKNLFWGESGVSHLDHMFDGDHIDTIANIDFDSMSNQEYDENGNTKPITARAMFKGNNLKQLAGLSNDGPDGKVVVEDAYSSFASFIAQVSDMSEMFANNQLYSLNGLIFSGLGSASNRGINADGMFINNHLTDLSNEKFLQSVNLSSAIRMFENNNISKLPDYISLGDDSVIPTADLSYMFANNQLTSLPKVNWIIHPGDQIKELNLTGMFMNNKILDVSKSADWDEMVRETPCFGKINLAHFLENNQVSNLNGFQDWNTSTVTDMSSLFKHNKITDTNSISQWDTSSVTDMHDMFYDNQIVNPELPWRKNSKLINTSGMFAYNALNAESLVSLESFNASNVTDMHDMFKHNKISNLNDLYLNTSNVTNMSGMFSDNLLTTITSISPLNLSNVIDAHDLFKNNQITHFGFGTDINISFSSLPNIKNMSGAFDGNQITYADLTGLDLTNEEKLGNFVNADTNSVVIVKPVALTKVSGTSQNQDNQTVPVINTKQNQLHFGSDVIDMPTVYTATDKSDARQKILADINTKLADYQANHVGKVITPTTPLDQLTELADLANAKFTVNNKPETASISYIDDTTGKTLATDMASGVFDSVIKFATDPTTKIADYVSKGYELVSNNFANSKYADNNNSFTVHLKHRIETPTDNRANTTYEQIVHYQDENGNKLADDTVIKVNFHRDYTVDMVTNVPTIGKWGYVKDSLTQTGTHIDGLNAPSDRYNKVDGFDSFNLWIPYRTFTNYHAQYSGLAASCSIPNGEGYVGFPKSENTAVYELNDQSVVYQFVDKDGKVVGTYTAPSGKVGSTVKIDDEQFLSYVPIGYYFADNDFQVPVSYTYTDVINPVVNVEIAKAPIYTLSFYDDTANKTDSTQTWSAAIDNRTHRLAGTVDQLNSWLNLQVNEIKWKNYFLNVDLNRSDSNAVAETVRELEQKGFKPSALIKTSVPQVSDLSQDVTTTIHFKHNIAKYTSSVPLWTPTSVQLTDQGMQALLDMANGDAKYKEVNYGFSARNLGDLFNGHSSPDDKYAAYIDDVFNGARWMTGGMLSGGGSGLQDNIFGWNGFNTIINPTVDWNMISRIDFTYPNQFYPLYSTSGVEVVSSGKLVMLPISGRADLYDFDNQTNNEATIDLSGVLSAVKIPHGYSANVIVPIMNGTNHPWQLVTIKSQDLQKGESIIDYLKRSGLVDSNFDQTSVTIKGKDAPKYVLNSHNYPAIGGDRGRELTVNDLYYSVDLSSMNLSQLKNLNFNNSSKTSINDYVGISDAYKEAINDALNLSAKDKAGNVLQTTPVTMFYTLSAAPQQVVIKYVDQNGKTVKSTVVNGHTGEQTNLTFTVPDNYFATSKLPATSYVFTPDNKDIVISVEEKQIATGNPTTSDKDTLNLINYTDENGKVIKIDKVTGKIGDTVKIDIPNGYHFVNGETPTIMITESPAQTVKIIKDQIDTGNPTTINKGALNLINYTDENGKVIKTDKVTGKIGDTVKVDIPDGYHFVDGDTPVITVTENPEQTVKIVKDQTDTNNPTTSDKDTLNLINYMNENGKVVKTDKVIGKIGDKVNVSVPGGYHFVDGKIPVITVTEHSEQIVKIVKDQTDTGNPATSDKDVLNLINYTDENGKVVKTDKVTGKIGDKIIVSVPDGYHFVDGKVPTVVITKNPERTVKIIKDQIATGDPTTSDKDALNLISYADENGKIIKIDKVTGKIGDKITVNVPAGYHFVNGKVPAITITENSEQTVKIEKDQTATGDPTISDKDILNLINYTDENGKVIKTDKVTGKVGNKLVVNVPDGYHFVDDKVPTVVITENPEQTVKIVKDQIATGNPIISDKDALNLINYTDKNGKVIKTDKVTGKIGAKVNVTVPDGYHFADGETSVITIAEDPVRTVKIIKDQITTGNPATSDKDALNLINYTDENGKVIKTDKVTGRIGDTVKVDIPNGYHFVDDKAPTITITENSVRTVKIAKDQITTGNPITSDKDALNLINYTDENGKVIKTDKITGRIGDKVNVLVPDGYHFVDDKAPTITITENPVQVIKIVKDQVSSVNQQTSKSVQVAKPATTSVEYNKNGSKKNLSSVPAKQNVIVANNVTTKARHLPQTGGQQETGLVALGLASGLLGLIGLKKKKQN